jgi:DNA polymerase III delta prime subunit
MPFRDIVGHRRLVSLVARSIHRGTLPPSLILAGPEGVGKRLLAVSTGKRSTV